MVHAAMHTRQVLPLPLQRLALATTPHHAWWSKMNAHRHHHRQVSSPHHTSHSCNAAADTTTTTYTSPLTQQLLLQCHHGSLCGACNGTIPVSRSPSPVNGQRAER